MSTRKRNTLPEPPPWVRVKDIYDIPANGRSARLTHPLNKQVVSTAGRDHGADLPGIFCKGEDGTEYWIADSEWEHLDSTPAPGVV